MLFGRAGYLYAVLFTRAVLQDPAFGAAEARATIAEILDRDRLEFMWHGKRCPSFANKKDRKTLDQSKPYSVWI